MCMTDICHRHFVIDIICYRRSTFYILLHSTLHASETTYYAITLLNISKQPFKEKKIISEVLIQTHKQKLGRYV